MIAIGDLVTNKRNGEVVAVIRIDRSTIKAGQRVVVGGKYQKLDQDIEINTVKVQYSDGEMQLDDIENLISI